MSSIVVSGIQSAKEAAEIVLGQIPKQQITKIVVILFNEPNATTFTSRADIERFYELNQALPISYRKEYDCFSMLAGAGGKNFSTVMVYVEGEPDGYTLVVDLNQRENESFPFSGSFTAGPFETTEAAELYAVNLLIREGIVGQDGDGNFYLKGEGETTEERFNNRTDLLDAWHECLEGLEWFHIFPALKIPAVESPAEALLK